MKQILVLTIGIAALACGSEHDPVVESPPPPSLGDVEDVGGIEATSQADEIAAAPPEAEASEVTEEAQHDKAHHAAQPSIWNLVHYNYLPLTLEEIVAKSQIVAVGKVISVSDGRTIDFRTGPSNPLVTSVLGFRIDQVMVGEALAAVGDTLAVEFIRARAVTSAELAATAPSATVVMFLQEAVWDLEHYVLTGASTGLGASSKLYTFATPQGFLAEGSGSTALVPVLDSVPLDRQNPIESLVDLKGRVGKIAD